MNTVWLLVVVLYTVDGPHRTPGGFPITVYERIEKGTYRTEKECAWASYAYVHEIRDNNGLGPYPTPLMLGAHCEKKEAQP